MVVTVRCTAGHRGNSSGQQSVLSSEAERAGVVGVPSAAAGGATVQSVSKNLSVACDTPVRYYRHENDGLTFTD